MEFTHYQILGISGNASQEDIKAAYKKLAKKYHPDKHGGNEFHEEHFKKINSAYQVLSDPVKKRVYDDKLLYRMYRKPSGSNTVRKPRTAPTMRKPSAEPFAQNNRKMVKRAYLFTLGGFILLAVAGTWFYQYMNNYTAEKIVKKGLELEASGRLYPALEAYTEALEYTDHARAYERRGHLRIKLLDDYKGAVYDYSKALEEKPTGNLYFWRAKCHIKLQNYKQAVGDLTLASALMPEYDSIYFYRAEINNYKLNNYEAAKNDYDKVLKLNTQFSDALFGRAMAYYYMGEHNKAISDLDNGINISPARGNLYYYRAWSKMGAGDTLSACEDFYLANAYGFRQGEKAREQFCRGSREEQLRGQ